jgi:myo-inositol-1(or 4)-monophosphatase
VSRELLDVACDAARAAGTLQKQRFGNPGVIDFKSTKIDLVTEVDKASEALLLKQIRAQRPDDSILSEETGPAYEGSSGVRWVIDPLDGTVNFAHGVPHFAVSIGVEVNGRREVGVIYDPMLDELYTAARGQGAWLNGKPIRVSGIRTLEAALLATGFAYTVHHDGTDNLAHFVRFMKCSQAVRRPGSAALDLAYVASGRFDGFWECDLHAWDVAAGLLIVEEAGGRTSDFRGNPAPASGERCLASNGHLHDAMQAVLAQGHA